MVAVADTQSNSVVVSAPDEYMDTIAEIVSRLDTSTTDVTQTRLFHLEHADATEVSTILNTLYGDPTSTTGTGRTGQDGKTTGAEAGRGGAADSTSNSRQPPLPARANSSRRAWWLCRTRARIRSL